MKQFKIITALLLTLSLTACFHDKNDPIPPGSVTVEGNITNDSLVWQNYIPNFITKAFAVDIISTRSELTVTNPERLTDVSISTGIQVNAEVINSLPSRIEGYSVDIFVEDEQFLTKETWACHVCYSIADGNGTECEGLWEIQGDTLFETNPDPILPTCDITAITPDTSLCITQFNNNPDCLNPTYKIEYQDPGNGLWNASMPNITVEATSTFLNTVGLQSSGWITGTNKYARFILFNENNIQVAQRDYVFNVID